MTIIDRKTMEAIRNDMEEAFKAIADKHEIAFQFDGAKFSNGPSGSINYKILARDATGEVQLDAATQTFMAVRNLTTDAVLWSDRPGVWKIVGYNSRAHKYPVTVRNEQGQGLRIGLNTALRLFGKNTASYPAPEPSPTVGRYAGAF